VAGEQKQGLTRAFWPLVIGLLIVVGIIVVAMQMSAQREAAPTAVPTPSTNWTTAPEEGVDVNLPETRLRRVDPDEAGAGETAGQGEVQD
jgi:hypothetical protein